MVHQHLPPQPAGHLHWALQVKGARTPSSVFTLLPSGKLLLSSGWGCWMIPKVPKHFTTDNTCLTECVTNKLETGTVVWVASTVARTLHSLSPSHFTGRIYRKSTVIHRVAKKKQRQKPATSFYPYPAFIVREVIGLTQLNVFVKHIKNSWKVGQVCFNKNT